jgi:hypothetical protein
MYQVLPVRSSVADRMARDERFRKISFTGSPDIGWYLKGLDPKKRVTLELGGNAGVIVHSDADLDMAAARIAFGGYYQAGQSCISVQRVLVQSEVYDDFAARLVKEVENLKTGDPMDPTVDVGPVITRGDVDRIDAWVQEAVSQGAQILTGGRAEAPFYHPTLLAEVQPEMKVCREEIFGPVVTISPYQTFDEAIGVVNDSRFGLQAGVFTNDINRAFRRIARSKWAADRRMTSRPSVRSDAVRRLEGLRASAARPAVRAMEEMTEAFGSWSCHTSRCSWVSGSSTSVTQALLSGSVLGRSGSRCASATARTIARPRPAPVRAEPSVARRARNARTRGRGAPRGTRPRVLHHAHDLVVRAGHHTDHAVRRRGVDCVVEEVVDGLAHADGSRRTCRGAASTRSPTLRFAAPR